MGRNKSIYSLNTVSVYNRMFKIFRMETIVVEKNVRIRGFGIDRGQKALSGTFDKNVKEDYFSH